MRRRPGVILAEPAVAEVVSIGEPIDDQLFSWPIEVRPPPESMPAPSAMLGLLEAGSIVMVTWINLVFPNESVTRMVMVNAPAACDVPVILPSDVN